MIKRGKLYWFPLDCKQIDDFFLVRLLRKFNYIPFTLRFHDKLFLREDRSKYSKLLINFCRKKGIETFVVEEGARYNQNPYGHSNLQADWFVCQAENYEFWKRYMPLGRIIKHRPDWYACQCQEIVFMYPLYVNTDVLKPLGKHNSRIMEVIERFRYKPVVFKLHPKNLKENLPFFPKHRVVDGKAEDLILKYSKVYCFKECSIRKDCEMLGVTPHLL